jgi:rhodanese-related sulfurtransferase
MLKMYALILVFLLICWLIQHVRFLRGVTMLSIKSNKIQVPHHAKWLDIRDVSDFEKGHVPESINISLGRLPFVWGKDLSPKDGVVILTEHYFKGKKAVRILRKHGFYDLYLLVGPVSEIIEWSQKNKLEQYCFEYNWICNPSIPNTTYSKVGDL